MRLCTTPTARPTGPALVCLLLLPAPITATVTLDPATYRIVASPCLNLRESARSDARVLTCLPDGATGSLIDSSEGWVRLRTSDGRVGWVAEEYLQPVDSRRSAPEIPSAAPDPSGSRDAPRPAGDESPGDATLGRLRDEVERLRLQTTELAAELEAAARRTGELTEQLRRSQQENRRLADRLARVAGERQTLADRLAAIEATDPVSVSDRTTVAAGRPAAAEQLSVPEPPLAWELSSPAESVAPEPSAAPEPAEPVSEPTASQAAEEQVVEAVRSWAAAWSTQRVEDYLAAYGEAFRPADGASRERWQEERRARLQAPRFIEVELDELQVTVRAPDRAAVDFLQSYRSDRFADRVRKRLEMALEGGSWKIHAESVEEER